MNIEYRVYAIPKTDDEGYEDSYSIASSGDRFVFALADGVSSSCYSKTWADLLTKHFVSRTPPIENGEKMHQTILEWLNPIKQEWEEIVNEEVKMSELPWYIKEKLDEGSYSTLLGLEINLSRKKWSAISIGDTCLFQIRLEKLLVSFPIEHSDGFSAFTDALNSKYNDLQKISVRVKDGMLEEGDIMILATDAFSHWFLKLYEENKKPWDIFDSSTSFEELMEKERSLHRIVDDDITVIFIKIAP